MVEQLTLNVLLYKIYGRDGLLHIGIVVLLCPACAEVKFINNHV